MSIAVQNQIQPNTLAFIASQYSDGYIKTHNEIKQEVSYDDFELLSNYIEEIYVQRNKSEDNPPIEFKLPDYEYDFRFDFFDFNFGFNLEIINLDWSLSSNKIVLYLNLENHLIIKVTLEGYWEQNEEPKFQLKNLGLKLEKKQETPLSVFLASSLWAMLGLASNFRVQIPQLNYDLNATFKLPYKEISLLLQERQIAYRLMVIEQALGISLPFPNSYIKGEDIESIAFCYHAIVDREFDWFSNPTIIPWEATKESVLWLPKNKKPTSITFRPEPVIKSIFGIKIPLGLMTARIDKAIIDNYEEVKERLLNLDGSIVDVKLRSVNGISRMISLRVPKLPQNPWSKELQKLIDIDSKLDSLVLEGFFNLAASSLKGLTEEQKEAITKRPDLNEETFEI
ncbi:MAG TPA: hypothetical protein VK400_06275 [Pyrinomonadaceae bacterium]|nr:hypothetical protein [Pyrinomonadaceae bacterium]